MTGAAPLLTLALLAAGSTDPRVGLVEEQMSGEPEAALASAEGLLDGGSDLARGAGLNYLRGRLLERLGRSHEAIDAFLTSITATPALSRYGFYRVATEYENLGHPEMAAGIVARVVADGQDFPEIAEATRMLRRCLAAGGACQLLVGLRGDRLPRTQGREIALARAECALRAGDPARARELVTRLLNEERGDEPALEAAELAASALGDPLGSELARLVGLTLHEHRQFARSNHYLDLAASTAVSSSARLRSQDFEIRYARVRNDFWLGDYRAAAAGFADLATRSSDPERRADALYQQGRSLELLGDWQGASASFRRSYLADPLGQWAGHGLLAALRLEWRSGSEASALELYDLLLRSGRSREQLARASLFLASSDLVRGRSDRAGQWLAQAERSGRTAPAELAYWRGRLAEARGEVEEAVAAYLEALKRDPYHPFALEARRRLIQPTLAPAAAQLGIRLAASGQIDGLTSAWLLLGEGHPRGRLALASLAVRLSRDPQARAYLQLTEVPVPEWRLWQSDLVAPEELLLALGLWGEGAPAVSRHFPISEPALAFTGCSYLSLAGETRRALLIAEILDQRRPSTVPDRLVALPFRRLLYPLAYSDLIFRAAHDHGVDPYLLAAVIREESRFEPRALSLAAARGLTQMTDITATRLAPKIGRREIAPDDLYQPAVSIPLGAAYLEELEGLFGGSDPAVVAAYNAGEDQARLWMSHCFSKERAEYLSKVGFRQTRVYLQKVLGSRAHYREIYGPGNAPSLSGE